MKHPTALTVFLAPVACTSSPIATCAQSPTIPSQDSAANILRQLARVHAELLPGNKAAIFQPTWNLLPDYRTPDWFRDAKFGIFIH